MGCSTLICEGHMHVGSWGTEGLLPTCPYHLFQAQTLPLGEHSGPLSLFSALISELERKSRDHMDPYFPLVSLCLPVGRTYFQLFLSVRL